MCFRFQLVFYTWLHISDWNLIWVMQKGSHNPNNANNVHNDR